MTAMGSIVIGFIAGCIVVVAVLTFDKIKIDDPVGAVSVHLVCGIWGTLAVGLFGAKASAAQFMSQLTGVVAIGAAAFGFAFLTFYLLKKTVGIRVTAEEETVGLDLCEHGMTAYRGLPNAFETEKKLESDEKASAKVEKLKKVV